jgi:hypothetical protein
LRTFHLWWVLVLIVVVGCTPRQETPRRSRIDLESLLPDASSLQGWHTAEGPTSYAPDTLWEYLDGGAPRYLTYGLVQMVHVRYQLGDDPLSSLSLELYDMGSELGAFGIYSSIRPPDLSLRPWGAEGYRAGDTAAAWKGEIFAHASTDDERAELTEVMEWLLAQICEHATGATSPPPILNHLPSEDMVPHSERYVASDLFGHAALPGGVLATYEIGGRRGDLFYSELPKEIAAEEALEAFRREKARWTDVSDVPHGFRFEDPSGTSGTVLHSGRFVIGVQGDVPFDTQDVLLSRLDDRLLD